MTCHRVNLISVETWTSRSALNLSLRPCSISWESYFPGRDLTSCKAQLWFSWCGSLLLGPCWCQSSIAQPSINRWRQIRNSRSTEEPQPSSSYISQLCQTMYWCVRKQIHTETSANPLFCRRKCAQNKTYVSSLLMFLVSKKRQLYCIKTQDGKKNQYLKASGLHFKQSMGEKHTAATRTDLLTLL